MSALILGDVHLEKNINLGKNGIGTSLNSRISDQLSLLDWTLEQAIDKSVDNIIITGDIFEHPKPNTQIITLFISWLKKCQSYKINVHIIAGNHDILRTGNFYISPLDIVSECDIEGIYVYKDIDTVIIDNCAYTLLPFRDRKSFNCETNSQALEILRGMIDYENASIPLTYKKVLVGHLAIEGSIPVGDEIDDLMNELFCPLDMFSQYDYVWMGHVHKFQVMSEKNSSNYVAHIGSMDISNFGESEQEKKIVVMGIYDDCFFKYFKLPNRGLKKISISIPENTEDPTKYCLDQIESIKGLDKSIVKIEIGAVDGKISKKEIESYLSKRGVYSVSNFSESKKINVLKKDNVESIDNQMSVPSAIKKWSEMHVEENKKEEVISLSMEIYNIYELDQK